MRLTADREGRITEEDSRQDRILEWLYSHRTGRLLLRPLVSAAFSRIGGLAADSRVSRLLIPWFIRGHAIDMSQYQPKEYRSYNDFFSRKLAGGARSVNGEPGALVSPCDGRLSVRKITGDCVFKIKHTAYTVESLLGDRALAAEYAGGYVWIFRLQVEDYHRYIYVDEGAVILRKEIPGVFHTVNPVANDCYPIYKENTRAFCVLQSAHFGRLVQMEVGAMLVGKIVNHSRGKRVCRGWEKGYFAFGGSTVVLLTRKGAVCPDRDIRENSAGGIETRVRLGERVGYAVTSGREPDGSDLFRKR